MRVYECECNVCGTAGEYFAELKDYNNAPSCTSCGGECRRVIRTAPHGYMGGNFEAFQSPVDCSVIKNKKELADHNRRNDVVSLADGYTTQELLKLPGVPPKEQPRDVKTEVVEAYQAVKAGYKPQIGAYDE